MMDSARLIVNSAVEAAQRANVVYERAVGHESVCGECVRFAFSQILVNAAFIAFMESMDVGEEMQQSFISQLNELTGRAVETQFGMPTVKHEFKIRNN